MSGNDAWMRKVFRTADAQGHHQLTKALGEIRKSRPPDQYHVILGALRTAAPKTARSLFALGTRSPSDLIWARAPLELVAIEHEFLWAEHWLAPHSVKINVFRQVSLQLQTLIFAGNLSAAIQTLDEYVRAVGWSFWAVELRAALLQVAEGTASQRAWLDELQSKSINSLPGLLFQVFSDRNDDTFSYDAIYGKCLNSFPRFSSLASWVVDYLNFRALSHFDSPRKALPAVLSRDITSSLIDYYEDTIEAIAHVEIDETLDDLRPTALRLASDLLAKGFQDHRLCKLKLALGTTCPPDITINTEPVTLFLPAYLKETGNWPSQLLMDVNTDVTRCQEEGVAAYETAGKLLKWGLNFKGLDFGAAVATSAIHATSQVSAERVFPLGVALLSEALCVDDAAALTPDAGSRLLRTYLTQIDSSLEVDGDKLYRPRSWRWREYLPNVGPIHLWLALQLVEKQLFDELDDILEFLRTKGSYWVRQGAKIEVLAFSRRNRVEHAINLLEEWFRKDSRYAVEFPISALFFERKWSSFKELDPIEVGLVSHYAYEAGGNTYIGYVCKMACRKFMQTGMRERVADIFDQAPHSRRAQLVGFLRDVWIEQNLAMCHQFESTAQVRVERMSVLQLLLSWEHERAAEYAEAIKDLTFDQTLQQGLERIDQTRVFVNESAITRWAEKDLIVDFERWRKLSDSSSGGRAVDDMLRQYAVDPSNIDVLKEFADGKPTAADAALIDVIDRLFKRFLLDPTDGLDTYLSVRIRHGSFRGTILGPLEEQGLLYSATGFSKEVFVDHWDVHLRLRETEIAALLSLMEEFSKDVRALVDEFVDQQVQIARPEKPDGVFHQVISSFFAKVLAGSLAERPPSFHAFLCSGYFIFWKLIEVGLNQLHAYISGQLADALRGRIDMLIQALRTKGTRYIPLITTLTTVSTMTKSQCDTVAEWFRLPSLASDERYHLPGAIEIASVATKNVHRSFPANVQVLCLPAVPLPLTTSALAVLMDCLFIVFENAWRHSGLGNDLPPVALLALFEPESKLLTFEARSDLSPARRNELLGGELSRLRAKYLGELPLELISLEGGSGFPKLARLTRSVPRETCSEPFFFDVEDGKWITRVTVPLYKREEAFEAYE
jgi:hypothetical protein